MQMALVSCVIVMVKTSVWVTVVIAEGRSRTPGKAEGRSLRQAQSATKMGLDSVISTKWAGWELLQVAEDSTERGT